MLVVATVLVLAVVRHVVVQVYAIPSGSMQPLLEPGDRVLVSRLGDPAEDVRRGDVVVFDGEGLFTPARERSPVRRAADAVASWLGTPAGERDFVKRVIGLPGDRVTCCDDDGSLLVNGEPLAEPYLFPGDDPSDAAFDVEVPAGRIWLMGDHRSDSADSRAHLGDPGGGMVPWDRVVGPVVAVAWPPSRTAAVDRGADATDATGGVEGDR